MKQTLSANSLFHFTSNLETLNSILKNNFFPSYSIEDFSPIVSTGNNNIPLYGIPMVCFCDIPLSQIRNHISTYGEYAIGLSKEWGIRNNISPVMYYLGGTSLSSAFCEILQAYGKYSNEHRIDSIYDSWMNMATFIKPYEGYLHRNGELQKGKTKFYDEREWRFVPISSIAANLKLHIMITESEFNKIPIFNEELRKITLNFVPQDIKYIIVKNETEITQTIKMIRDIKGKYSFNDVDMLITRIISMEQVLNDF